MEIEQLYTIYLQSPLISTDTRTITPGCLFFALKGDNFDGNSYAEKALEAGASYAVIDNASYKRNNQYVLVTDVLECLQQLARHHRSQLNIPVIGITGTNGKTTTKELINSVLSQKFKTYATRGNLNNHIGVPLTLLSITAEVEISIIEMGANHQKEIELLCSIARPTHGLITNVGKAHLEGFGGTEGVKKGKGEMYDWLLSANGRAFINRDNPLLVDMARERGLQQVIYYGTGNEGLVSGDLVENDPLLKIEWWQNNVGLDLDTYRVQTQLTGTYNLENILSAACIGAFFKLSAEEINKGISRYQPSNNRSQIKKTKYNTIICDYYNANPSSMIVALENFSAMPGEKKVMILGDMFELGDEAASEHQEILQKALGVQANKHLFIGEEFYKAWKANSAAPRNASPMLFKDTEEAYDFLKNEPVRNATILIKGSRGMKLEKLIALL